MPVPEQHDDFARLQDALARAIREGRLCAAAEEASQWATSTPCRALLADASRLCDRIRADVDRESARVATALRDAGVDTVGPGDATAPTGENLATVVRREVAERDVAAACRALMTLGYAMPTGHSAGALEALRRSRSVVQLISDDHSEARVELVWRRTPSKWRRMLGRPSDTDLAALSLPRSAWMAYALMAPVRHLGRRLRGRAPAPDLGPFLGTPHDMVESLLDVAGVTAADVVVDIGCGDGRIVAAAARRGATAVGYETDRRLVTRARQRITDADVAHLASIHDLDGMAADLAGVTVALAFLPAATLVDLVPRVLRSLPAGARLVVHEQHALDVVPGPERQVPLITSSGASVAHIWLVPAEVGQNGWAIP